MNFLQTVQAPVTVTLGKVVLTVPKMTMQDFIEWGSEVHAQTLEKLTGDMDANRRREFLAYYNITEPDIQQLAKLVDTAAGIKKVLTICLSRAKGKDYIFTEDLVPNLISANGPGRMVTLVRILADLQDNSTIDPSPAKPPQTTDEGQPDPLTNGGKSA